MTKINYAEVLDLFCWGMDKLTRPTLRNLVAGYDEYAHRKRFDHLVERLRHEKLLERRGRGEQARFSITAKGWERLPVFNPRTSWDRHWDRRWRVFSFDVPESRRSDRVVLWQALRSRKLGFLQRSVWVWPHDVEPMLRKIVVAEGIPECFCGFEVCRLFLCSDAEVVKSAWDFEEIGRRHDSYLRQSAPALGRMRSVKDLAGLATLARVERQSYQRAFSRDPLLPRTLWPRGYSGEAVQKRHDQFLARLRERFSGLASA